MVRVIYEFALNLTLSSPVVFSDLQIFLFSQIWSSFLLLWLFSLTLKLIHGLWCQHEAVLKTLLFWVLIYMQCKYDEFPFC